MSAASVLDSSAFLAYLNREPGFEVVKDALAESAAMCAVNWSEVLGEVADAGEDPALLAEALRRGGIVDGALMIVPFEEKLALEAARLRPLTRLKGLSFGDRACLALGLATGRPIWTADHAWTGLALPADVRLIR